MRTVFYLFAVIALALPTHAEAQTPREIIEKAIQAHGGAEKLAKLHAGRIKAKGDLINGDTRLPFVLETTWQLPDRIRIDVEIQVGEQKNTLKMGFDGRDGWASANEVVNDLVGKKLDDLQGLVFLRRLWMLTPLLTDKTFELAALGDAEVDGQTALGLSVDAKGRRQIKLYFDKKSGLLVRIDRPSLDDVAGFLPQEDYPTDYKVVDGVQTAMKQAWYRGAKQTVSMEVIEVKYLAKIEANVFARPVTVSALDKLPATRKADVIYARKFGAALTMDVFTPKEKAHGAAVVVVVSGGWFSDSQMVQGPPFHLFLEETLKRGYTVFAVVHGSQPKFIIPEAIADVHRAVRYIRHHAKEYKIDPQRIAITGGSAGGHLSLMLGTTGDKGNPDAIDPVERTSSKVQAVACFFPPTDFLNYGEEGKYAFAPDGLLSGLRPAVDLREFHPKTQLLERVTDEKKVEELARLISPITHVKTGAAPTLIIHGDADVLVPIQQAQSIMAKFKEEKVPADLVVRKGRGHDFKDGAKDMVVIVDWFDKHLKATK